MTTLEYRLDYQRLVSEISTRFVHLESAALDAAIDDTLARLGGFTAADRCYLFLFSDDGQWMSNTHEWVREGVSRESHGLQDIPLPVALPYFSQKMAGWEVFHVPRVEQLGPEASAEKKLFQSQKIQSLLVVPMVMEDRLIGCLGLDAVLKPADWPPDTTALLRLVGEVFVNALIRKRNEDALRLSEQRFRDVLRNIPDLYFRTDMDGRLVLTNNEGARLLGHDSVDQVLGLNVVQEFQHDPRARERMLEMLIREGRLRHFEIQLENRLGQKLDVEIHCHLVRDENGKAVAIEGLGRDITLRKQAERELQESQARFRDLVERLPDVFYQIRVFRPDLTPEERDQVDRGIRDLKESDSGRIDSVLDRLVDELGPYLDMTITYANQTAGQVLGYPLDQVGSVTLALVLDPKEMARAERDTLRIFHRQRLYGLDFELLGSRGDRIPLQVNAYLSSNEFPYLVNGVGRDVTELTRAQRELREAKEYNDSILRSMRDSLLVLDPLLRVHMANKATRDILGYEKGDLLGRPFRDIALGGPGFRKILIGPDYDPQADRGFRRGIPGPVRGTDSRPVGRFADRDRVGRTDSAHRHHLRGPRYAQNQGTTGPVGPFRKNGHHRRIGRRHCSRNQEPVGHHPSRNRISGLFFRK
jgi:PAS domain S-box-containing protein